MLITRKGDGIHFYGYDEQGNIHEVIKVGRRFYLAKLIIGEGLLAIGSPLKNLTFVKS